MVPDVIVVGDDVAVLIPVVAVNVAHLRPVGVDVVVTGRCLARTTGALDVILHTQEKESGAVRRSLVARAGIFPSEIQSVVVRAGDAVVRCELGVSPHVESILIRLDKFL